MHHRTLGRSGIQVSEIGFGAWAIGGDAWGPVEDAASIRAMERALELGVNFIDTADVYGNGHSEELVAQVIRDRRDQVVVATKGGLMGHHRDPKGEPVYDRPEKIIRAFEDSLRRLGTDYIDVYFDHIWWNDPRETEAFMTALAQLKQQGRLRAAGVSTDDFSYVQHFNRDGTLDVVQLDYSLLRRGTEQHMLPYCQQHAVGVVVRGPLRMGMLTGKFTSETQFPEGDVRHSWPQEDWFKTQLEQVEQLRPLTSPDRTMGQLALQFVLNHPAVSVAIPGAKTPEQVEQNVAASRRPLLSQEDLSLIERVTAGGAA
ncbi:aldo/keto reductase [Deinococcus peraridilitoris]|uniref:Putative oxidoreductase, aryl-alcohol dehydrogenase like protein n=1 Tax=Deinococcus peraridilitoris (strain DSM 19664 / LMG 22246 / CIP 109416 / KR-200) TaxID=937777 RepID=L0A0Z1_DEIPD|nr:aldo/keto reductase [Deinococcus peraridilitoris]AFZ66852.1 putative oxidoreductase, aryl-alcohol dehydrogenase like protein [Deinococcus peraridilitoris DSM 19664]